MSTQYHFYQRHVHLRVGEDHPEDWPLWDLYSAPQHEGEPNPYYEVSYLPVVVETDLHPDEYGGGAIEWQDAAGLAFTTDDAEAQGLLKIIAAPR